MLSALRRALLQVGQIFPIHDEDEIEFIVITLHDLSGPVIRNIHPATPAGDDGASIRLLAHMIGGRTGTVALDDRPQARFIDDLSKNRLGHRAAANIARANKQNFNDFHVPDTQMRFF